MVYFDIDELKVNHTYEIEVSFTNFLEIEGTTLIRFSTTEIGDPMIKLLIEDKQ
jgi:hypothetical protein